MTTSRPRLHRRQTGLLAVQGATILVASILLISGVLGFVPGVTANLDALHWAGPQSNAALFGIFDVSILDNLILVAVGVAGLLMAATFRRARAFLLIGGLLFLGFWIHGLLINFASSANVLPVNHADNWLHLGLGATMILLALTLAGTRVPTGAGGEVLLPPE